VVILGATVKRRMIQEWAETHLYVAVRGLVWCLVFLATAEAVAAPGELLAGEADVKKRSLWLAFFMLAGIIVGGTLLLALVVMWGNRTRRLARRPLPPVAQRDELWFLKPKPDVDDSTGEIDQAPTDA
jgi:hypothetical protein